jgi:prevent-host-death family protein
VDDRSVEANMPIWTLQDASSRFGELLDTCLRDGPQVVSRHGAATAVLVPIEDWRRQPPVRPTLKGLLLGDGPRWETAVPPRGAALTRRASLADLSR